MRIEKDKKLHLISAFIIGLTTSYLLKDFLAGIGLSLLVGIGKEFYDKLHPKAHTEDIKDVYYDTIGAIIGASMGLVLCLLH